MGTAKDAALAYVARGWWVIPLWGMDGERCGCGRLDCSSPGKHPCAPLAPKGLCNATTDPAVVSAWWDARPGCNVGVVTGQVSGLVVLDIDPRNGGEYALEELEAEIDLPATVTAQTGSGGTHLMFAYPADTQVRSRANALGQGIDLKGSGGYVVVPPSRHASGRQYAWELAGGPEDVPLASLPLPLLERLARPTSSPGASGGPVPKGERNQTLFDVASAMRRNGCGLETISAAIHQENSARCVPMLPSEEVERIAKSAARYEPQDPLLRHPERMLEYFLKGESKGPLYTFDAVDYFGTTEPPPETDNWWIQGIVPKQSPVVLAGPPKSAKSIVTLDMALCVASGRAWAGAVQTRRARTLYLSLEDAKTVTQRRLWHLARGYGMKHEEVQGWLGVDSDLGFNFLSGKACQALRETIDKHKIELVFIDSLSRAGVINENDRKEMSKITVPWQDLCRDTGATVVVIHHFRKASREADGSEIPLGYRLRGSGDLFAFVRHVVGVEAMPKLRHTSKVETVGNYAETVEPFAVSTEAGKTDTGETLRIVHRGPPDELGRAELREQVLLAIGAGDMTTNKLVKYLCRSRASIGAVCNELESEGLIFKRNKQSPWTLAQVAS